MKFLLGLLLVSTAAVAQDPSAYLRNFDNKIYSLKSKGVKDFVVDIESSKLTKQLNEQQTFGKVDEVLFRTYWTAEPERIAVEVIGLPEGFKEVKEELKAAVVPLLENLVPPTFQQRFPGYKFSQGQNQREIIAKDSSGIAPIPSYALKFNNLDVLESVTGQKPVGSFLVKPLYEKESFADGKLVLKEQTTTTSDNGATVSINKELEYGKVDGIGVLTEVTVTTEQKFENSDIKPVSNKEVLEFKNYKINQGEALKYFLGNAELKKKPAPQKK